MLMVKRGNAEARVDGLMDAGVFLDEPVLDFHGLHRSLQQLIWLGVLPGTLPFRLMPTPG